MEKPRANEKVKFRVFVIVVLLFFCGIFILYISGTFGRPEAAVTKSGVGNVQVSDSSGLRELESEYMRDTTNATLILSLANRLSDAQSYMKAAGYYKKYLSINPGNADVWVDLGVCYYGLRDYAAAKESISHGLKIDPKHQIALLNMGIVSFAAGDREEARSWWQKAAEAGEGTQTGIRARELLKSISK
ncbi:MAG: tetratricopeptide repeat protein [Bacteroidota bacterium]